MPHNYQNGKIYRIFDVDGTILETGMTIQPLYIRVNKYRGHTGKVGAKIELIEAYPCSCREELQKRLNFWLNPEAHNDVSKTKEEPNDVCSILSDILRELKEIKKIINEKN